MSLSEFSSSLMIHQLKPSQCLKPLQPSQPFATLETLATLEILATLETLATFEILATLETSTPSTRAKIMNEAERTWHHMNNIIGLKPSRPFTLCEPITVDLRIAATVLQKFAYFWSSRYPGALRDDPVKVMRSLGTSVPNMAARCPMKVV